MVSQATTRASEKPLRRVPVQGRSVARVARMLDACAELLDEVGYDGLTTTQLAERAGVAIGSVYQFFPDKRAVVQALTVRHLQAYLDRVASRLSAVSPRRQGQPDPPAHWWDGFREAVDEYTAMYRTVPGFRILQHADVADEQLLDDSRDNATVVADQLLRLLADRFEAPPEPAARMALAVAIETVEALTRMAFRRHPDGDPAVLAECETLLRGYLDRRLPASATGRALPGVGKATPGRGGA